MGVQPQPAARQGQHPHAVLQDVKLHGGRAAPGRGSVGLGRNGRLAGGMRGRRGPRGSGMGPGSHLGHGTAAAGSGPPVSCRLRSRAFSCPRREELAGGREKVPKNGKRLPLPLRGRTQSPWSAQAPSEPRRGGGGCPAVPGPTPVRSRSYSPLLYEELAAHPAPLSISVR